MKKVIENIVKSILTILVWDVIELVLGNGISIKANIIGFIVFLIVWTIMDYFNKKDK